MLHGCFCSAFIFIFLAVSVLWNEYIAARKTRRFEKYQFCELHVLRSVRAGAVLRFTGSMSRR